MNEVGNDRTAIRPVASTNGEAEERYYEELLKVRQQILMFIELLKTL